MKVEQINEYSSIVYTDNSVGIFVEKGKLLPMFRELWKEAELPKHIQGFNLACEQDAAMARSELKTF